MIIVQLKGGLGNQMFQYAMGLSLAQLRSTELKLDISYFENYEWHSYGLHNFNIKAQLASKEEVERLKKGRPFSFERFINDYLFKLPTSLIERDLRYSPEYFITYKDCFLNGYWQSQNYFVHIRDIILDEFTIRHFPAGNNQTLLDKILTTENTVSVHLRRGNFVTVEQVNKIHGVISVDYYEQAMDWMISQVSNPLFVIFSDEIEWARENLPNKYRMLFVDENNAERDYEDLRLMNACKNHIIANSTFSWWGAWLNQNPNKIVVAPKRWFADPEWNRQIEGIVPEGWIRI